MIVITGAAGFIASCLAAKLNEEGFNDLVLVDDFSREDKRPNYLKKTYTRLVHRNELEQWMHENHRFIQFVFHLGARTDTTEFDHRVFDMLNVGYSQMVWRTCVHYGLPLVYASSAATYGLGELGYDDNEALIPQLKPLNPYGESKKQFDVWALEQSEKPYFWAGLKFFNVYGPNEYHKGRMASVIFHAYTQIKEKGSVKLFRSHHPDYSDGEQLRDFVYVMDVVNVCMFLMHHRKNSGIYNLGSGRARTFLDLARNTFKAMNVDERIEWMDTPADIRDKYQYFTEANMQKLTGIGYTTPFTSLEDGVEDYVKRFLIPVKYY
ncbi:MAG: ADP-glyceromanno-heptose 6-epimerase [Bacteroidia bacterium]|nr:ADP-glyceromanno-heptose 6-epimerase [Bacteroidia bacterium]